MEINATCGLLNVIDSLNTYIFNQKASSRIVSTENISEESSLLVEQDHHQQGGLEIDTNKAVDMREEQHQHAGKPDEIEEVSVS